MNHNNNNTNDNHKLFSFHSTLLRVRCSMVLRSVSYFLERDQGHDHVTHGDRGVNGIVKDKGRGEIIRGF